MGVTEWLSVHPWITYLLIYVLLGFIYNKVFRIRKLPILKELVIYLLLGVGAFILLIFQIDKLPIVFSLGLATVLIVAVRIRDAFAKMKRNRKKGEGDVK